ncbi:glycosyltransferase family 87 protein [Caballeronia ptereochthonis]|uniref:Polyprenol-phosphate-mannose-dependent alpha-(1-2)-phosphatidylinositol mannoside mannosyltransferase n=1 Tax=Caballeronia ptereochthonis TaxID=1777144 RepID=A0A158CCZ9_9BURK|nr:glycosyltransferase family 87 protein [Caballeronia ptereochthonis]SAK79786.1 hypothetical protein AWB83_04183 [Caballeronia ptereochthonis]
MDSQQTVSPQARPTRASPPAARTRALLLRAALIVFILLPTVDLAIFGVRRLWLHLDYASMLGYIAIWVRSILWHPIALDDSWAPMRAALVWLNTHSGDNLYHQLFFIEHIKFQYPPSSLLPLRILNDFSLDATDAALNRINAWVILLNSVTCGALAFVLATRSEINDRFRWHWAIFAALATLSYFPLQKAFSLGQVQVWNNALFALAALAWTLNRRLLTGCLIGLICLLKPQFVLFILWGLLRREWRFCAGWVVVVALGSAASLIVFGLDNHLGYFTVLQALSRTGEAFIANQSVNGFLNRLLGTDATPEIWKEHGFPVYSTVVYLGTLLTSGIMIAAALLVPLRTRSRSGLFDFLCGALTFTIASPIAWDHHFGIMPAVYLALMLSLSNCAPSKARSIAFAVLIASYFVTDFWLRGSWMLCGVLATLGLVHWSMSGATVRESGGLAQVGYRPASGPLV